MNTPIFVDLKEAEEIRVVLRPSEASIYVSGDLVFHVVNCNDVIVDLSGDYQEILDPDKAPD